MVCVCSEAENVPMHLHSSSEETDLDFRTSPLLSPDLESFLPLRNLSLNEDRKFNIVMETTNGASSCGMLNLAAAQSISEFSQSRDRCLSEPSMCFDTAAPLKAPPHPPVIRQSSCDNAIMDNKTHQSQSPLGHSRGTGKGRYTFWKSPQFPARFRHPTQRLASMSSLSSTTTSSLSSLDSAEYIPSPSDDKPRPFLFGTSARLRPLTPEMPRKLWTMAFSFDELKDGNENKEKEGEVKVLDLNFGDKSKEKDEQEVEEEGQKKVERSEVMEEGDGEIAVEEHKTPPHDEGISSHIWLPDHEDRDVGLIHTLSHTHTCPVHTNHARTLHTHTLALPSKQDKTSRMKITLFPSVGKRMFRQSAKVTMATGAKAITMAQVNVPQTLFYNQNVNLVLQSEGRQCRMSDADDICTCDNVCINKGDTSHELSIDAIQKDFSLSNRENDIQSGAAFSQTVSNISNTEYFNQNADSVSKSDSRVSINASASTHQEINVNDPSTVSIDSTSYDSESTHVSQNASSCMNHEFSSSIVDHISNIRSVSYSASPNISTTTTNVSHGVSVNKISQSVSISPGNASQHADASMKTSIRQTIRIRLPATMCNSVRAYFSPTHTLKHSQALTVTQTQAMTHTHLLPKSQNRPQFTSKLQ